MTEKALKRIQVKRSKETLSLSVGRETATLTIDEAEALMDDLSSAQLAARRVRWRRIEAEKEAARLAAQANEPWGLWSHGKGMVHMGVSWPENIVDTLPLDEAIRLRDAHNAALKGGGDGK